MENTCNVYFVYEDGENAADKALGSVFKGEYMNMLPVANEGSANLYVGLGKQEKFKKSMIKEVFGKTAKKIKKLKAENAVMEIGHLVDSYGQKAVWELVQGLNLGAYEFTEYKQSKDCVCPVFQYTVHGQELCEDMGKVKQDAENMAHGINYARTLVNTPANHLTPQMLAENVVALFNGTKVEVSVLDEKQCSELGMETFLAIGNSSAFPPRVVVMRYLQNQENPEIYGYVGKGITYDTGGYSLKPAASMLGMKTDMAGAAAVVGAIYALAKNQVQTNVVGVLVCAENRISNGSCLPGDVIKSMNGKTIEVTNTDAEGRLVLADGITYVIRKENVTKLIDIATLTGACVATLGHHTAGVLTNNKHFYRQFKKAVKKAGEKYWQLPIDDIYRKNIKSDIADMRNSGAKIAGTTTGACFIEEFVEEKPWLHLDIAGTSFVETPPYEYQVKGATGAGVAALYTVACEECK